ncbi:unnamed protein product [Adineta steineri]|uniref:LIM zinc-binding domain-containing protein n=1 Tax=Adineta steineri TaxID=433720 RepID=A0A815CJQ8_9BILA|nr:unnamed protein product [Adineta steineri]CAF1564157.1 unnamed protein product [Adineta steineri]
MAAEKYIYKIVLELQPRSLRGYRGLFGIRENKFFNKESFDINDFTKLFLNQVNNKSILRGEHIKCCNLIVAVEEVKSASVKLPGNTQLAFRLRGRSLSQNEENKEILNDRSIHDIIAKTNETSIDIEKKQNYSCYGSGYEFSFDHKCARCSKLITVDHNSRTRDGITYINYVEYKGSYFHSDCCFCFKCSMPLAGNEVYEDESTGRLFCLNHDPEEF